MIETRELTKTFVSGKSEVRAVDQLTLNVNEGEVFGFLGPNGAGKTTTVRMLTSLIAPTAGSATIRGIGIGTANEKIRAQIGLLTESPGHYERLSAETNLDIFARLYHIKDRRGQVEKYLRLLDLWDRRKSNVSDFSKGMKQKLAIARALLHEPPLLFLDEPTSGLDPESAKTVRDFIETLKQKGRTIFICTHNLGEAERLCDRIGVFRQKLIAVDTPDALRKRLFGRKTVVQLANASPDITRVVETLPFVSHVEALPDATGGLTMTIDLDDPAAQNPSIVRALVEHDAQIQFVNERKYSLEDVYFSLLNGNRGDA